MIPIKLGPEENICKQKLVKIDFNSSQKINKNTNTYLSINANKRVLRNIEEKKSSAALH